MTEQPQASTPEIVTLEPAATAVVRATLTLSELPGLFDSAFGSVAAAAGEQGVAIVGPAFAHYLRMPSDTDETFDLEVGFPTAGPITPTADVRASSLPGGPAGQLLYIGPYDALDQAYARLQAWLAEQGCATGETLWEFYLNEPTPDGDPNANETLVVWPVSTTSS